MARENSEPAKCIDSLLGVAKAFDFRALLDLADSDVAAVLVSFDSVVDYHENLELRALEIHQQVDLFGSLVPISGERCVAADARYISPWVALPGYRHTVGMARAWHFL